MSKTYQVSKSYLENGFRRSYIMVDDCFAPGGRGGPGVSVTRAGKQWFWIAAHKEENLWRSRSQSDQEYIDYPLKGYAPTKQEAINAGLSAIGFTPPAHIPDYACMYREDRGRGYYLLREITQTQKERMRGYTGAGYANNYLRTVNAMKKIAAPTADTTDGLTLEFAYIDTFMCAPVKHKILKRTKKRVFIDSYEYREDGRFSTDPMLTYTRKNIVVDRERFDAGEEIRISSGYCTHVFNEARMKQRKLEDMARDVKEQDDFVSRFKVLSLAYPVTRSSIKSAYRMQAKSLHPDVGGDAGQFVTLKQEYETAMAMFA
jgi:uncharacterized protein YlaI